MGCTENVKIYPNLKETPKFHQCRKNDWDQLTKGVKDFSTASHNKIYGLACSTHEIVGILMKYIWNLKKEITEIHSFIVMHVA